jgi:hypothetical protein
MDKYPWNNDFEWTSWQPNQNKLGNLFMCLDLIKDMIEKHDSFNMLSKTMTIDISTYLRYSNNCCFKKQHWKTIWITSLSHNWSVKGGSKACLLVTYTIDLKNEIPKASLCSFNRASTLKPSSPNSSKQLCFQHRLNGQGMWYLHQSSSNSGDT